MNRVDRQLYELADGQVGNKLEKAIAQLPEQTYVTSDWGGVLLGESYLIAEPSAQLEFSLIVSKHWGIEVGQSTFYYAVRQGNITQEMCFNWLNREKEKNMPKSELLTLYVQRVGELYFLQPIYRQQEDFWRTLYAKKLYSCFLYEPLSSIQRPLECMQSLQKAMLLTLSKNRTATILHKLIQKMTVENPQTFTLKQINLFNICNHFTSGRKHLLKLHKCIEQVQQQWCTGEWAITEKEQTLFAYMLLREAVMRRDREQIIQKGLFLIENERLHNYAVELVLEYGEILEPMSPQPMALIKNYEQNYLEYVFFVLMDALVIERQFEQAYNLLLHYELASCEAIYTMLHEKDDEQLPFIEATIQRNIAFLVHDSIRYTRESIAIWSECYHDKKGPYFSIAWQSSQHITNVLKVLFMAEEDYVLEKLLKTYKKYVYFEVHFASVRQLIEQRIHEEQLSPIF